MYIPRIWLLDVPTIEFQCHILLYAQLTLQLLGSRHWKRNCPRTDSTDWKHHPKTLRPNAPLYILLVYSRICWLTLRVASCFCLSEIKKRTNTEIFFFAMWKRCFSRCGGVPKTDTGEAWDPVESCSELLLFNVSQTIPQWWAPTSCKQCFFSMDTSNHEDVPFF